MSDFFFFLVVRHVLRLERCFSVVLCLKKKKKVYVFIS